MSFRKWFFANLLGWLLSIVLILVLSGFLDSIGIEGKQFYLGIAVGLGLGGFQYLRLQKIWPIGKIWIWSMVFCLSLPFLITDFWIDTSYDLYLSLGTGILFLCFSQYGLLRRFHPKAKQWLMRSLSGWMMVVLALYLTSIFTGGHVMPLLFAGINLILLLSGGPFIALFTAALVKETYR